MFLRLDSEALGLVLVQDSGIEKLGYPLLPSLARSFLNQVGYITVVLLLPSMGDCRPLRPMSRKRSK